MVTFYYVIKWCTCTPVKYLMMVYGYLRTILTESWIGFPDFWVDFVDFWISEWISGFLDFTVDFWISVWISVWISADAVRDFFLDWPLGFRTTAASSAPLLPGGKLLRDRPLYVGVRLWLEYVQQRNALMHGHPAYLYDYGTPVPRLFPPPVVTAIQDRLPLATRLFAKSIMWVYQLSLHFKTLLSAVLEKIKTDPSTLRTFCSFYNYPSMQSLVESMQSKRFIMSAWYALPTIPGEELTS